MKEIMRKTGMRLGRINREYVLLFFIFLLASLLIRAANAPSQIPPLAPHQITLTSFYPSPFGEYNEIRAKRIVGYNNAECELDPTGTSVLRDLRVEGNIIMHGRILSSEDGGKYYIYLNDETFPPEPPAVYVHSLMTARQIVMNASTPWTTENPPPAQQPPLEGKHVYGHPDQDDIAEGVFVKDCEAGDVVIISADENPELIKSTQKFDRRVAGVISTDPKLYLYSGGERMPLALAGIVPCKVTAENGPVKRGDMLVSSSMPGHAMRADSDDVLPGMVVGRALEPLAQGTGLIYILVN